MSIHNIFFTILWHRLNPLDSTTVDVHATSSVSAMMGSITGTGLKNCSIALLRCATGSVSGVSDLRSSYEILTRPDGLLRNVLTNPKKRHTYEPNSITFSGFRPTYIRKRVASTRALASGRLVYSLYELRCVLEMDAGVPARLFPGDVLSRQGTGVHTGSNASIVTRH